MYKIDILIHVLTLNDDWCLRTDILITKKSNQLTNFFQKKKENISIYKNLVTIGKGMFSFKETNK